MAKRLVLLLAAGLLSACSATHSSLTELNHLSDGDNLNDERIRKVLDQRLDDELSVCDTKMQELRTSFSGSSKVELGLASVGIIAGSIVVPALAAKTSAAKSAIAAWGGLSGATNAAQYTLHQKGASASSVADIYENTRQEILAATTDYAKAADNQARTEAIIRLSLACRFPRLPQAPAPTEA